MRQAECIRKKQRIAFIVRRRARTIAACATLSLMLAHLSAQTTPERPDVQWQLPGTMYGASDRRELVASPSGQLLAYYHTHDAGLGLRGYISVWKLTGDNTFALVTTMKPSFNLNYSYNTSYSGPRVAFAGENHLIAADGSVNNNGVDYFSIDPSAPADKRYRRLATYTETGVTHTAVSAISSTRFVAVGYKQDNAIARLYEYNTSTETITLLDEEVLSIGEATCVDCVTIGNTRYAVVGTDSGAIFALTVGASTLTLYNRFAAPAHVTRIDAFSAQGILRFVAGTLTGQVFNGTNVYVERTQDPVYDIDVLPGGQYCWVSFGSRAVRLQLGDLVYAGAMEYPAFQGYYYAECLYTTNAAAPLSFAVDPNAPAVYTVPVASVPSINKITLPTRAWEIVDTLDTGAYAIDSVHFLDQNGTDYWRFTAATGANGRGLKACTVTSNLLSGYNSNHYVNLVTSTIKDISYLQPVPVGSGTTLYLALQNGQFAEMINESINQGYFDVGGELHAIAAVYDNNGAVRVAVGRS